MQPLARKAAAQRRSGTDPHVAEPEERTGAAPVRPLTAHHLRRRMLR